MIYLIQLYLLICFPFLAGKDADSYLLKDKKDNELSIDRVKRWHRDGVAISILVVLPLLKMQSIFDLPPTSWWKVCIAAALIRLTFFDLAFNRWASLPVTYLGSTAWLDKQFVKIFGINGAVKKSLTFSALWISLNVLNHFL